jgi:hypothetical protein
VKPANWLVWLRLNTKDPNSPTGLKPGVLGALTGQDVRALSAIAECWEMYASGDDAGRAAALAAVRALLPAVQPSCHRFARELIARSLDWDDRAKLWPLVRIELEP